MINKWMSENMQWKIVNVLILVQCELRHKPYEVYRNIVVAQGCKEFITVNIRNKNYQLSTRY